MTMNVTYDGDVDAAYIYFVGSIKAGEASKSVQATDDVILDFDKKGKLLGMEVLNASKKLSRKLLTSSRKIAKTI